MRVDGEGERNIVEAQIVILIEERLQLNREERVELSDQFFRGPPPLGARVPEIPRILGSSTLRIGFICERKRNRELHGGRDAHEGDVRVFDQRSDGGVNPHRRRAWG